MMDATLIDPDLGTRIQTCILIDAIASKLSICRRGERREGNTKFVKQLETIQTTAAKKVLGGSNMTSNTGLIQELRRCPLNLNRDVIKVECQY